MSPERAVPDRVRYSIDLLAPKPAERVMEVGCELTVLRDVLVPGGRLVLGYGAGGPQDPARVTGAVESALREAGFQDVESRQGSLGFAVVART